MGILDGFANFVLGHRETPLDEETIKNNRLFTLGADLWEKKLIHPELDLDGMINDLVAQGEVESEDRAALKSYTQGILDGRIVTGIPGKSERMARIADAYTESGRFGEGNPFERKEQKYPDLKIVDKEED